MLKPDVLKQQLKDAIDMTLVAGMKEVMGLTIIEESKIRNELMESTEELMKELVAEPLAELLAEIIDAYIKNISITGTLITNGSPSTHMCNITTTNVPDLNGKQPNTLHIS